MSSDRPPMGLWSRSLDAPVDAAKVDAGWERVRARRDRPRALRKVAVAAPVLLVAALVLLAVRAWLAPTPVATLAAPATIKIAAIALEGGGTLPTEWKTAVASPSTTVPLDDGSRLEIAPKTQLRTRPSAPERVELALEEGKTTFDVRPGGPRAWIVDAGDVRVEVLGTRFTVARDGPHVAVSVERGKVKVTDPKGEHVLTAGQSFASDPVNVPARVPVADDPVNETPAPIAKVAAAPAKKETAIARAPAPSTAVPIPTPAVAATPTPEPEDPMSRADALRKRGRSAEAVSTLRELVDRGDRRASLAAFTLGKVHAEDLHDPLLAARWFERAITIGLPGGLDEEAAARAVECFAKGGSRAEARRAAERYEARFPGGRRIAQVREWAGAATP